MNFQELQTGNYFRITGMSADYVYRKASSSHCSLSTFLQPIRPEITVVPLTPAEITKYFSKKQEELKSLMG
jgi:hypothetical protein